MYVYYVYIYVYVYMYIYYVFIYIYIYISEHNQNAQNDGNRAQPLNSFHSHSVPRHGDVHWFHHGCYMDEHNLCGLTSEPSQSSSRRHMSFKDSSALLNNFNR